MIHEGDYPQWNGGGQAWCSPTSTSMVLGYYDSLPGPQAYSWVPDGHTDPWVDYALEPARTPAEPVIEGGVHLAAQAAFILGTRAGKIRPGDLPGQVSGHRDVGYFGTRKRVCHRPYSLCASSGLPTVNRDPDSRQCVIAFRRRPGSSAMGTVAVQPVWKSVSGPVWSWV